jgi:hypothetical protein
MADTYYEPSRALASKTLTATPTVSTALAYALDNFAGAVGGEVQGDASGNLPTGIVELRIGSRNGNAGPWCGHIRRVRYWPTRLNDAMLARLTR